MGSTERESKAERDGFLTPDLLCLQWLQCDAVNGQAVSATWTLRTSLLTYFMALSATLGAPIPIKYNWDRCTFRNLMVTAVAATCHDS
jgi:hypothetical protein